MGKRSVAVTETKSSTHASKRRRLRNNRHEDVIPDVDGVMHDVSQSQLQLQSQSHPQSQSHHHAGPSNAHIILNTDQGDEGQYDDEPTIVRRNSQRSTLLVDPDDEGEGEDDLVDQGRRKRRKPAVSQEEEEEDAIVPVPPPHADDTVTTENHSQPDAYDTDDENLASDAVDAEADPELEEDEDNDQPVRAAASRKGLASSGILSSIRLDRFMSHKCFVYELGPNVNILNGKNGSGKSAIVAALQLGLGGKANITDRGERLDKHISYGENSAIISINILNQKTDDATDMTYKHDVYGDMITIERRIIRGRNGGAGTSSWAVKGKRRGAIKLPSGVTPRREAMDVFHHFGFMVHNPVAFLTQDNSKKFLAKGKATAHYKLYREATLLEPLMNELIDTRKVVRHISDIIQKSTENRESATKKLEKLEAAHRDAQEMKNIHTKIKEAAIRMAWTEYMELKYNLDHREERTRNEFEPREARAKNLLDEAHAKMDIVQNQVKEKEDVVNQCSQAQAIASTERRNAQIEQAKVTSEVESMKSRIAKLDMDIADADRRIEDEHVRMEHARTQHFKGQEQKTRLIEDLKQAQGQEKEAIAMIQTAREEAASLESRRLGFRDELLRLQDKNRRLEQERDSKYREFTLCSRDAQSRGNLSRFGREVPLIFETLQKNADKFQVRPIGPIGHYIKLRDESWAGAIEQSINRSILCAFLVQDSHDERLLLSLLPRNCRRPNVYIVNMRAARYNVTAHTKPNVEQYGMCTVMDQITVENDTVFNALVDFATIEQLVLNEVEDITKLAWSHTPNVKSVWNKAGEHATSRGGSKVFRGAPRNFSAHLLTKDLTRYIESVKRDADEAQRECIENQHALQEHNQKNRDMHREVETVRQRIAENERLRLDCERKRHSIEDHLNRAEDAFDPSPFERSIADYNNRKEEYAKEQVRCHEEIAASDEKLKACQIAFEESRQKLAKAHREAKNCEALLQELMERSAKVKSKMRTYRVEHEKSLQLLKDANEELDRRRAGVKVALDTATGAGPQPENIDIRAMPSEKLQRRVEMLNSRLQTERKRRGGRSADDIERDYLAGLAQYNENAEKVKRVRTYHKSLRRGLEQRDVKLRKLEKTLKRMVRFQFRKFLGTRNHDGDIRFESDGNNKELVISAKMASHDKGDGERHETMDLRSLSGGERSFTTLCFMMALAEICQNPIRVMDEIDVYQDEANRRASFKILVDFFQTYLSDRQVIIITPHSLPPNINSTQTCRIVKLEDPRREGQGQTRIDDYIESQR